MTGEEYEQARKEDEARRQKPSHAPDIHRLLPQSAEAEQGVLCSFLLAPKEVYGLCLEKCVRAEHFYIPAHAMIYSRLCLMADDPTKAIDSVTIIQELHDHNQLDQCGGPAFLSRLSSFLPTAANAAFYVEILMEKATLRSIISVCTEYASRSYDEQHEVQLLLDECEAKILGIARERFIKTRTASVKQLTEEGVEALHLAYENRGKITGIPTGFVDLDRMTDGMHAPDMIVIAARPSMGKTALAMNIADFISVELGKPIAFFSLEMSGKQLIQRWLCARARIDFFRWRDGFINDRDFTALAAAAGKLADARICLDEGSDLSIQEIRARARRMKSDFGIEAIFVDYLQFVRSNSRRASENRQIEVGEVSGGLKQMAKELGVPVIVLAQIGRGAENDKRRPRLSDLRESGNIEQDADDVWFLTREEMYAESEEAKRECEGKAKIQIAKARNGPVGDVPLTFIKEWTKFENRARAIDEEEKQPEFRI